MRRIEELISQKERNTESDLVSVVESLIKDHTRFYVETNFGMNLVKKYVENNFKKDWCPFSPNQDLYQFEKFSTVLKLLDLEDEYFL